MKSIVLNKNISRRVESGHPWIFANEVNTGKEKDTNAKPGEIVDVLTFDKVFIGRGYYNPQSQISVRLLTRDKNEVINDDFFLNRIKAFYGRNLIPTLSLMKSLIVSTTPASRCTLI